MVFPVHFQALCTCFIKTHPNWIALFMEHNLVSSVLKADSCHFFLFKYHSCLAAQTVHRKLYEWNACLHCLIFTYEEEGPLVHSKNGNHFPLKWHKTRRREPQGWTTTMNVVQLTKRVVHHSSISKPVQISDVLKLGAGYNQSMPFPKHVIYLTQFWYVMI